jgi:hypothetical protein
MNNFVIFNMQSVAGLLTFRLAFKIWFIFRNLQTSIYGTPRSYGAYSWT